MVCLISIVAYLISLAIALMCGVAAIVISVAVLTGKPTDPETAALLAAASCLFWPLCNRAVFMIANHRVVPFAERYCACSRGA